MLHHHPITPPSLTHPTHPPIRFIRKQLQTHLTTNTINPQLHIKFYSPKNSFKNTDRDLPPSKSSSTANKIVRKPSNSKIPKTIHPTYTPSIHPQSQLKLYQTHLRYKSQYHHSIQQENNNLNQILSDYQQQIKKYQNIKTISHSHHKKHHQLTISKSSNQSQIKNLSILQNINQQFLTSQKNNQQLISKINQLEAQNIELSQKYHKKHQQVKYQQIQLGTLKKKKHQLVALQIKLLRLTEKNRVLQQKVQMLKKQGIKLANVNKSKKRKNSSDSMFSLSSDYSEDSLQFKQLQSVKK